jgi:hypothetical protein
VAIVFELTEGDAISIDGGRVVVSLSRVRGRRSRLAVDCARSIDVRRVEDLTPAAKVIQQFGAKGVKP